MDAVYEYFRGSAGFALLVSGLGLILGSRRSPALRQLAHILAASGILFTISAIDPFFHLPWEIGNPIIIAIILVLSQSLFDLAIYVEGGERVRGARDRVRRIGIAWSILLVLLPWLDPILGLPSLGSSVEDRDSLPLFHMIASVAIYLWPLAMSVVASRMGRWRLREFPSKSLGGKAIIIGASASGLILALISLGSILAWQPLYRLGQSLLELFLLGGFLFVARKPEVFGKLRQELRESHARTILLSKAETEEIRRALAALVEKDSVFLDTSLDLASLASRMGLPAYRLSKYFNTSLNTSFPAWLNGLRISHVCAQMRLRPHETLLDLALEAGYGSKAVFNAQFSRIMGMSPSEYRKTLPKA